MQLINDLLNFSRYQNGLQKLTLAPCSIEELLEQARLRFADAGAREGHRPAGGSARAVAVALQADQPQLDRVLDNLIDNACAIPPATGRYACRRVGMASG